MPIYALYLPTVPYYDKYRFFKKDLITEILNNFNNFTYRNKSECTKATYLISVLLDQLSLTFYIFKTNPQNLLLINFYQNI